MAGLPWIRLDTGFPSNAKILGLIADRKRHAAFGYVCALAWSGGQGTDGFIPEVALPLMHLNPESALSLCTAGLFQPVLGGYQINDWSEYQQSTTETAARSTKAQAAARSRWEQARQTDARRSAKRIAPSNANGTAKRNAEQNRTEQST
jgi:Na+/glutamate symporter